MTAPTIRQLHPDDWQMFRILRLEALRLEPAAYASTLSDWADLTESDWQDRLNANVVFAAFDGSNAVGLAGLRPDGAVIMVYVRAAARGQGHAQSLMGAVRQAAQARNMPRLWLHVASDNDAARHLYERLGYIAEGCEGQDIVMARTP